MAKKKQHGGARAGSGRPAKYSSRTRGMAVTVPEDMIADLDDWAESRELSRSEAVVRAIGKLLKASARR